MLFWKLGLNLLFLLLVGSFAVDQISGGLGTTVFIVRHAEKIDESTDPNLSPEGRKRAEKLAQILGQTKSKNYSPLNSSGLSKPYNRWQSRLTRRSRLSLLTNPQNWPAKS